MAPQTPFYNLVLHPVAQAVSKSPLLPADFQAVTHKGPSLEQCPRSLVNSSFCHQEADSRTTHHDKRTERRPGTKKKKTSSPKMCQVRHTQACSRRVQ